MGRLARQIVSVGSQATSVAAAKPVARWGLMLVLLAAAMPVRFPVDVPLVHSISILDVFLIVGAWTLFVHVCVTRRFTIGDPQLFGLLALPLVVTVISMLWSQDLTATARSCLIYLEGLVAYAFVIRETDGLRPEQILTYMKRFVYLLIIPGVLLLFHVPGFDPLTYDPTLSVTSGDYISFYTRLSHPILGRSNNLATLLAFFIFPLLYWGSRQRLGRFTRAGAVALIAVWLTFSRGVILAVIVSGFLCWFTGIDWRHARARRPGLLGPVVVIAGLGLASVGLFYYFNPQAQLYLNLLDRLNPATVTDRLQFIDVAMAKIGSSPWLGYGGGVIPDHDVLLGLGVHNTYLQQILDYGVGLGLVVCVGLLLIGIYFLAHAKRHDMSRVLGFAVLGQLFIFMFESSFEGTVLKVLFYFSIGLAAGLLRALLPDNPLARDRVGTDPRVVARKWGTDAVTVLQRTPWG